MANVVAKTSHCINVTFDGVTEWDSTIDYPNGLILESIEAVYRVAGRGVEIFEKGTLLIYVGFSQSIDFGAKLKYFNTGNNRQRFFPWIPPQVNSAGMTVIFQLK